MLYIISRDYLTKKILKVKEYLIIDAMGDDMHSDIGRTFSRVSPCASILPGNRLISGLNAVRKGKHLEISKKKLAEMKDTYLTDREFVGGILSIVKAMIYEVHESDTELPLDKNVFVVIPNKAYKVLGDDIVKTVRQLFDRLDYKFIFSEDTIEEKKSILEAKLKRKMAKDIAKEIARLEKKFKLK